MAGDADADDARDLVLYDALVSALYADDRMTPGVRELALALAWVQLRDPRRHDPEADHTSTRVRHLLGRDASGRWRARELWAQDVPRYERPPQSHYATCDGPRIHPYRPRQGSQLYRAQVAQEAASDPARALRCGDRAALEVREHDLSSGWVRATWHYCGRHKAEADRVRQQIAALGEPPEPVPNCGGTLPSYFSPAACEVHYRWARPHWTPPYHGIRADDWPTPGEQAVPRRPRLSVVVG